MRNITKYAEQGKKRISDGYKLRTPEVLQLRDMMDGKLNNTYLVIDAAFHAGYEAGARSVEKKRRGRKSRT